MFWPSLPLGNALIVIDDEDELINEIDEMVRENLEASRTALGVLAASLPSDAVEWTNFDQKHYKAVEYSLIGDLIFG